MQNALISLQILLIFLIMIRFKNVLDLKLPRFQEKMTQVSLQVLQGMDTWSKYHTTSEVKLGSAQIMMSAMGDSSKTVHMHTSPKTCKLHKTALTVGAQLATTLLVPN